MSSARARSKGRSTRMLEPAEERGLIGRWIARREQEALVTLVAAHRPLVLAIAGHFRGCGLPLGDLIQEGHIGLLEAAHRFDPARAVRFATYAKWWIRSAIQEFALRNAAAVRTVTSSRQKSLLFALTRMLAAKAELGGKDRADLAKRSGVSLAAVERMAIRIGARDASLDAAAPGSDLRPIDTLADERPGPEDETLAAAEARHRALRLATLPARDRRIIAERHLSEAPPLLREVGRGLGVSKERVRQLEKRALARLKHLLEDKEARIEA